MWGDRGFDFIMANNTGNEARPLLTIGDRILGKPVLLGPYPWLNVPEVTMGCTQPGFEALAREIRRAQRRQEAMLERRRQRVQDRRERERRGARVDSGPAEGLICPRCRASYTFGDNCPTCGDELVCESWVDAACEPVRERVRLRNMPALAMLAAVVAVFGSVGLTLLLAQGMGL